MHRRLRKNNVRLSKIRYQEEEQLIWVEGFLQGYIKAINNKPASIIQLYKSRIVDELEFQVEEYSVTFKDVGFSEEKEIRCHLSPNNTYKVETRIGEGIFIPIIKLKPIDDHKLPIKKIIISPLLDFQKAEKGLRILLNNAGHQNVSIESSQIPFQL